MSLVFGLRCFGYEFSCRFFGRSFLSLPPGVTLTMSHLWQPQQGITLGPSVFVF